jgi:hypothetical protein
VVVAWGHSAVGRGPVVVVAAVAVVVVAAAAASVVAGASAGPAGRPVDAVVVAVAAGRGGCRAWRVGRIGMGIRQTVARGPYSSDEHTKRCSSSTMASTPVVATSKAASVTSKTVFGCYW